MSVGWLGWLVFWESVSLSASKISLKPGAHTVERRLRVAQGPPATRGQKVVAGIEQEPHAGRENGIAHDVGESVHLLRQAEPHRHVENLLGELDRALHLGAAAREHHSGGDHLLEAAAAQLLAHQAEELLVARLDDLGERLAREAPRGPVADARHLDALIGVGEL